MAMSRARPLRQMDLERVHLTSAHGQTSRSIPLKPGAAASASNSELALSHLHRGRDRYMVLSNAGVQRPPSCDP